ncbi:MAG TPA: S41 family peptidase, partial [Gemmatimonadaceae bacterium]
RGLLQDSLNALIARNRTRRTVAPTFTYELLSPHVGYMNFRSMGGDLGQFQAAIADMFRRVAADSDSVLVIDLRTNGGGDSRFADELLRYVTTRPYRMSAAKAWKMSGTYRAHLKAFVRAPWSWLHAWNLFPTGRQLFHGPDGTIVELPETAVAHPKAEPFFGGAVCVLIGPQTFSSATDLADAIKTYGLATTIGDETGGRANTFGEAYGFRLPKSQLAVSVSSARYIRASGDTADHRGVIPDVVVHPSDADRRLGRDVVLARARQCSTRR